MKNYYPLCIWLQKLDDFGAEVGEPVQSCNDALPHCQAYDKISNPRFVHDEIPDAYLIGEWIVQEREFTEHKTQVVAGQEFVSRNLTLYLKQT